MGRVHRPMHISSPGGLGSFMAPCRRGTHDLRARPGRGITMTLPAPPLPAGPFPVSVGPNPRRDMSRKKVSTTIYITPEQADRLKLLHERTKVPIAVYIREGIDMVLKHYEHVLPGQMSLEVREGQASAAGQAGLPGVSQSTPPPPPVKR